MEKKIIIGFVIMLAIAMIYGLVQGTITGNIIKQNPEKTVIYFPNVADVPNSDQGSIFFDFGFPKGGFKVSENKSADILMFLNSEKVPGLKIGYSTKEKKVYAGMPLMGTKEIDILDGNKHNLVYNFNRNEKKQNIVFDGAIVAEGEFTGQRTVDALTGYAIYQKYKWVAMDYPMEIKVS